MVVGVPTVAAEAIPVFMATLTPVTASVTIDTPISAHRVRRGFDTTMTLPRSEGLAAVRRRRSVPAGRGTRCHHGTPLNARPWDGSWSPPNGEPIRLRGRWTAH